MYIATCNAVILTSYLKVIESSYIAIVDLTWHTASFSDFSFKSYYNFRNNRAPQCHADGVYESNIAW